MKLPYVIISMLVAAACNGPALAQDKSGSRDPDGLPRFEGAEIRDYRQPSLDEIVIPTGPVSDEEHPKTAVHLEGEVEHIDYLVKPAVAPLGVDRYYRELLQTADYTLVFSCAGEQTCGQDMGSLILNSGRIAPTGLADGIFSDKMRVIVARKANRWLLMHVNSGPDAAHIYVASVAGATEKPHQ